MFLNCITNLRNVNINDMNEKKVVTCVRYEQIMSHIYDKNTKIFTLTEHFCILFLPYSQTVGVAESTQT